jgi:hypothetical protein
MAAERPPVTIINNPDVRKLVEKWFTYHQPFGDQADRYQVIREEFKALALTIVDLTPACADQTAALRKLRECSMAVNQTIACNE